MIASPGLLTGTHQHLSQVAEHLVTHVSDPCSVPQTQQQQLQQGAPTFFAASAATFLASRPCQPLLPLLGVLLLLQHRLLGAAEAVNKQLPSGTSAKHKQQEKQQGVRCQ